METEVTGQILAAIEKLNDKLDTIKGTIFEVQSEMLTRFSNIEAWRATQSPIIEKLENKIEALREKQHDTEKSMVETRIKDRITTYVITSGIAFGGTVLMHFIFK